MEGLHGRRSTVPHDQLFLKRALLVSADPVPVLFSVFFPLYFTTRKITLCRTRFHRPDGRTLRFAFAFWSAQVSRCYNQKCSLKYEFLHVEQFKGGVCNEIVMNDTRSRPAGDLTRSLARSLHGIERERDCVQSIFNEAHQYSKIIGYFLLFFHLYT